MTTYKNVLLTLLGSASLIACGPLKQGEKRTAFLDQMAQETEAKGLKIVDTLMTPRVVTGEKMAEVVAVDAAGDYHGVYFAQRFNGDFRVCDKPIPDYEVVGSNCAAPLTGGEKDAFNAAASAAFAKDGYAIKKTLVEPNATDCNKAGVYLVQQGTNGLHRIGTYDVNKKGKEKAATSKYPVNPARH